MALKTFTFTLAPLLCLARRSRSLMAGTSYGSFLSRPIYIGNKSLHTNSSVSRLSFSTIPDKNNNIPSSFLPDSLGISSSTSSSFSFSSPVSSFDSEATETNRNKKISHTHLNPSTIVLAASALLRPADPVSLSSKPDICASTPKSTEAISTDCSSSVAPSTALIRSPMSENKKVAYLEEKLKSKEADLKSLSPDIKSSLRELREQEDMPHYNAFALKTMGKNIAGIKKRKKKARIVAEIAKHEAELSGGSSSIDPEALCKEVLTAKELGRMHLVLKKIEEDLADMRREEAQSAAALGEHAAEFAEFSRKIENELEIKMATDNYRWAISVYAVTGWILLKFIFMNFC